MSRLRRRWRVAVVLLLVVTSCASVYRVHWHRRHKNENNMGLFGSPKTREQAFWIWFEKNEAKLFEFERARDRVFAELATELNKVAPDLAFEFSTVSNGKREFVVSAEGQKSAFPVVETLVGSAPALPRWKFVKFRQRQNPLHDVEIGNVKVKASSVEVCIGEDGDKVGLAVFIPDVKEQTDLVKCGFLLLDEALGEYDVTMKVGCIEFFPASEHLDYPRFPLSELPSQFDRLYCELPGSRPPGN